MELRAVAGRIGVEAADVRLSGTLPEETVAALRRAVLEHKVVFFRNQHHLDDDALVGVGGRFGTVTLGSAPRRRTEASPIRHVDATDPGHLRANVWHTDHLFVERPPSIAILRAVVIPDTGGDTAWANTATAYAALPDPLRTLADALWVLHANEFDYDQLGLSEDGGTDDAVSRTLNAFERYAAIQPVVHVHPETGERCLLLGKHARHLVGLSASESAAVLRMFQDRITRPENTVRWSWRPGDVVMWDNRSTQHYAVDDWGDQPRILHRLSIAGDAPVAIDGRRGRLVQGDTADYYCQSTNSSITHGQTRDQMSM
jgi:taurine dioxygenase